MPHSSTDCLESINKSRISGSEDASVDEIKVFTEEGTEEMDKRDSEHGLDEEKSSLVNTSTYKICENNNQNNNSNFYTNGDALRFFMPPYHTANPYQLGFRPTSSPLAQLMLYNQETFAQNSPHIRLSPLSIDPKSGIPRGLSSYNPFSPAGQYAYPGAPFSQSPWQQYSLTAPPFTTNSSFSQYNHILSPASTFNPSNLTHPSLLSPMRLSKDNLYNSLSSSSLYNFDAKSLSSSTNLSLHSHMKEEKKKPHIKKPLNAFMLFMKEQRSKVMEECTLKESSAINQLLGRKWHSLTKEEQAKYYELARKERQLHQQMYPGWTARDNYHISNAKTKKKRKKEKCLNNNNNSNNNSVNNTSFNSSTNTSCLSSDALDGNNPKKCRARFGLEQQTNWCKPCRRKKKCIRFTEDTDEADESVLSHSHAAHNNHHSTLSNPAKLNACPAHDSNTMCSLSQDDSCSRFPSKSEAGKDERSLPNSDLSCFGRQSSSSTNDCLDLSSKQHKREMLLFPNDKENQREKKKSHFRADVKMSSCQGADGCGSVCDENFLSSSTKVLISDTSSIHSNFSQIRGKQFFTENLLLGKASTKNELFAGGIANACSASDENKITCTTLDVSPVQPPDSSSDAKDSSYLSKEENTSSPPTSNLIMKQPLQRIMSRESSNVTHTHQPHRFHYPTHQRLSFQ